MPENASRALGLGGAFAGPERIGCCMNCARAADGCGWKPGCRKTPVPDDCGADGADCSIDLSADLASCCGCGCGCMGCPKPIGCCTCG